MDYTKKELEATSNTSHVVEQPMEHKLTKSERFLVIFTLLRKSAFSFAELIDAFRIVPRLILTMYGLLIYELYVWYTSIETLVQNKCDAALLQILVDHGETMFDAQTLACQVVDHVGGPTVAQTAFVTTVVGLATPLFAFYANTGKKWNNGKE